ncbi:MAG: response regulator [Polyangiales bacterium]
MKILVADDSATMRKVMQMTFAGEDAEVITVESGEAAVQKARALQPDVIFADVSMPGMDGYEVARAIKNDAATGAIAVVVMASQQRPFDQRRGDESGVDAHVVKPFETQAVIDKAKSLCGSGRRISSVPVASVQTISNNPPATDRPAAMGATLGSSPSISISSFPPVQNEKPRAPAAPMPPPLPPAPPRPDFVRQDVATAQIRSAPTEIAQPQPVVARSSVPSTSHPSSAPVGARASSSIPAAGVADRLAELGLTPAQIEGVLKISAEVVERVVWEVVPDLAEVMIAEEIRRLRA